MKKYRINDILGDNNGSQHSQQNGIERQFQSLSSGQRFQLNQNLQNRIQRRYEADGSEEEEMQRQNQLLAISQSMQSMAPLGPTMQRNVNCSSGSGEETANVATGVSSSMSNIDANSLYHKLKELQEAEQRLKQVEDLMRSIEKMENNIKEVKRDSVVVNDTRKASNEMQTKFVVRNNVSKPALKSVSSTQPKQLTHSSHSTHSTHSANNMSTTNPQKNIIPRNIEETNGSELNVNTTQHLLSQTMDFCDNNLGYSTDLDESESNSEESFNLINGNLIRSMRAQFDSMRSQFETMLPVLENQFTNGNPSPILNTSANMNNIQSSPNSPNSSTGAINNSQFFHLMLLQNYQILQQQQMLLLWLQQQQQSHCPTPHLPQPMPEPPQRHQSHSSHQYLSGRHPNHSSIAQNSLHYRNSTLNSVRNNEVNAHNMTALNNQVVPGMRANNYWDNFKSYSRQNKLSASANSKANENLLVAHNQMTSPVLSATDQQMIHNTNPTQDLNSSPGSTMGRHSFKAANASHVQCVEHVEKQQNLPQFNESIASKGPERHSQQASQQHSQHSDSNNFAALFSMLEKLIENDDKYSSKSATKKKSTNLVITSDNEDELGGAVGGIGVTNVVNNHIASEESNETNNKCSQQQSSVSSRSQLTGTNMSIPLHIPASSGAIRKKPRNQEILELSSKSENSESFRNSSLNGSELIRPLMAAEGRSSETNSTNTLALQKTHILAVRPPTTGAPPYAYDSDSNGSSDDELAEADQTAIELISSESETIHNNNNNSNNCNINSNCLNTNSCQTNTVSAQALDTSQRSSNEDNVVVTNDIAVEDEDEEEEEDDDNILANESNEGAIRLSGDGEQGL